MLPAKFEMVTLPFNHIHKDTYIYIYLPMCIFINVSKRAQILFFLLVQKIFISKFHYGSSNEIPCIQELRSFVSLHSITIS